MRAVRSRIKTSMVLVLMALSLSLPRVGTAALSTGDLIRLKNAGLSDNTIQLIVESGYSNIDRVIKLKDAGFKDDTIVSVIRSDLKEGVAAPAPATQSRTGAASEVVNFETNARVNIQRYLVTSGDGLLMNDVEIDAAMVSVVGGKTLKLEFPKNSGGYSGYIFRLAEFKSPFYWDVNKDDTITPGPRKNIYVLKSTMSHAGRPETNGTHYWVISFEPAKPEIAQWIERARIAN
jgi:hypothetical protein